MWVTYCDGLPTGVFFTGSSDILEKTTSKLTNLPKTRKIYKDNACVEQHVTKIKIRDINSLPWIDSKVIHFLHKKDAA